MISLTTASKSLLIASVLGTGAMGAAYAADLSAVPSGAYEVDPTHAYINFQYNHLGLSTPTLSFDDFSVDLNLDADDPTQSTIAVAVDVASVVSGSEIWTDHLTSEDWFNVAAHPQMTFESTSIEGAGDGAYQVAGNLTIKDVTQPVTLAVTINGAMNHPMSGDPVIGLDASGSVLRSDFGMGKAAPAVSDEVQLNISVEMKKVK